MTPGSTSSCLRVSISDGLSRRAAPLTRLHSCHLVSSLIVDKVLKDKCIRITSSHLCFVNECSVSSARLNISLFAAGSYFSVAPAAIPQAAFHRGASTCSTPLRRVAPASTFEFRRFPSSVLLPASRFFFSLLEHYACSRSCSSFPHEVVSGMRCLVRPHIYM